MQDTDIDTVEDLILANRSQTVTRMIQMRCPTIVALEPIRFETEPDFFAITREVAYLR